MMKRLLTILTLLSLIAFAHWPRASAATISDSLADRDGSWSAGQRVQFLPVTTGPVRINGVLYRSKPASLTVAADGSFSGEVAAGLYDIQFGEVTRDRLRNVLVPTNAATYAISDLATNLTTWPPQTNFIFIATENGSGTNNSFSAPRLFESPYGTNAPGSSNYVWTLTNTVTGEGEWRVAAAGGGGSGGETNTASNIGNNGVGFFAEKVGVDLPFKTLVVSGATLMVNSNETNVILSCTALTPAEVAALINGATNLDSFPHWFVTNLVTLTSNGLVSLYGPQVAGLSNLIYTVGANVTNFTYGIGANGTNFTFSIGANGTNFTYTIGANGTNHANAIGVACSNLAYTIGANGTNFTYAIGANLTNFIYGIGANGTNFTYSIGANVTNYVDAINTALTASIATKLNTNNGTAFAGTWLSNSTSSGAALIAQGLVGIGTNLPQANLHIVGDLNNTNLMRFSTIARTVGWLDTNGNLTLGDGASFNQNFINVRIGSGAPAIAVNGTRVLKLESSLDGSTKPGALGWGLASAMTSGADVWLERDSPAVLALRGTTSPQTNRTYRTFTGTASPAPTNAAWIELAADNALGVLAFRSMADGSNQTHLPIHIGPRGTNLNFGVKALTNGLVAVGNVSGSNVYVPGIYFKSVTPVASAGTGATNVFSVIIPANMLTNIGDTAWFESSGVFQSAAANTNSFTINNGSEAILATGTQTFSNTVFQLKWKVTRTGNTAQLCEASFALGGNAVLGAPFTFTNNVVNTAQTNGIATTNTVTVTTTRNGGITNLIARAGYEPFTQ
jgi:hypothetical protein